MRPWRPSACLLSARSLRASLVAVLLAGITVAAGSRQLIELSATDIATLVSAKDPLEQLDPSNPSSHLAKILIPRVVDTEGNTQVRNYIVGTMKALDWDIEEDSFEDDTPLGKKRFTNVIATKDPKAARRVVVAAHFDSKWFESGEFLGATDSAAPCAIMLDLAETLNPMLESRATRFDDGEEDDDDVADTTLQLIFFDGEEAFHRWTDTDSIYGARHLAEKWDNTYIQANQKRRLMTPQATELSTMENLMLLDLLGAPNPNIRSFFLDTAWLFDEMAYAEKRLGESGALAYDEEQEMAPGQWRSWFAPRTEHQGNYGGMGDDHVPFLKRGVSVLHIIPLPFPKVWHKLSDDASALHLPTMRRWNLIMRVVMCEYLNLRPSDLKTRGADPESTETGSFVRSDAELVRRSQPLDLYNNSSMFVSRGELYSS
ncbi:hypothetical protein BD626DRAFT_633857 [Schizophyllum amplum]|uniref:Peptide hydrolase n=1 Tax=Schizophyllum amplum TaxID=97359 RepID=A0A550C1E5_9AGAR|nr:hypothetical protein BD626DRAFT_633857 [Auriculariopsis ampla]